MPMPMVNSQQSSYVAPQMMGTMQQSFIPAQIAPAAPVRLTEGIPTPEQIASQKAAYASALDKQLQTAVTTVQQETAVEKDLVKFNSEKQFAMFELGVQEKLAEALAMVDEQATFQTLELKKALVERNMQLSAQAQNLTMDYNMKALVTDCELKRYNFQVSYTNAENKLAQEYQAQAQIANTGFR